MLFSSADYPVFLIAVFFLYALARWGRATIAPRARLAVMVLLGDVVFMLVAKDTNALWDPIGGVLLRMAAGQSPLPDAAALVRWVSGGSLLLAAVLIGKTSAGWLASDAGQAWIGRGIVGVLATIGAVVALSWGADAGLVAWWGVSLDELTRALTSHGHLLVLLVLGTGLGATQVRAYRAFGRVILLFVASALFYHAWAAEMRGAYRYLLALLLATIVLDFYLGLWIERASDPRARKALVIVSLCSNLGILVVFKYTDFFTQDVLGLDVDRLNLILPAGISFHTFQSLSYTIDVYRKELRATRSVAQFATFVLFFPQLVAGPIVRAQTLLPQLRELPALELASATQGLFRIVVGLFKKIALADTLALAIVDRVFTEPTQFSSVEVAAGVVGYALQIYLDFSAYSDIAIGSAQLLGFELPENFATPYRSANLQEFWRRWHISLSTWLRDYLYIALGGSRGAPWRTYVNLILTMLLGGLWHGASWTFVVWGGLHGAGLAVTRYFQRAVDDDPRGARRLVWGCRIAAVAGIVVVRLAMSEADGWAVLIVLWLALVPLWAVLTAWLSRAQPVEPALLPAEPVRSHACERLRLAMCATGVALLGVLAWAPSWTWLPMLAATWGLAAAADLVERGHAAAPRARPAAAAFAELRKNLPAYVRRALAVALTVPYVCLAWIFFRASSFDNALAVLRQLGTLSFDHANVSPIVVIALATGIACHYFPDGSFRWLRVRFVALPPWAQGALLAAVALVLRELSHPMLVPFIYFQF